MIDIVHAHSAVHLILRVRVWYAWDTITLREVDCEWRRDQVTTKCLQKQSKRLGFTIQISSSTWTIMVIKQEVDILLLLFFNLIVGGNKLNRNLAVVAYLCCVWSNTVSQLILLPRSWFWMVACQLIASQQRKHFGELSCWKV